MVALAAVLAVLVALPHVAPDVWAQGGGVVDVGGGEGGGEGVVEIMPGEPCFLNSTHPGKVMQNCNPDGDWLAFALAPWEYVTGGLMSMMVAGVLILVVWAKYRQAIYPIFIGVVMLPISWFLFPDEFLGFGLLLAAVAVGAYVWWAVTRQTE